MRARRSGVEELTRITQALVAAGYTALDAQARALGLPRSTTWTIVKSQHKLGRLSQKVRARMLANPDLPRRVRAELEGGGVLSVRESNGRISANGLHSGQSLYVRRRPESFG